MFRTMAGYEAKHAQIMAEMGWTSPGAAGGRVRLGETSSRRAEAIVTMPLPDAAVASRCVLALVAEQRAEAFFGALGVGDGTRCARLRSGCGPRSTSTSRWCAPGWPKVPHPAGLGLPTPDPPRYTD